MKDVYLYIYCAHLTHPVCMPTTEEAACRIVTEFHVMLRRWNTLGRNDLEALEYMNNPLGVVGENGMAHTTVRKEMIISMQYLKRDTQEEDRQQEAAVAHLKEMAEYYRQLNRKMREEDDWKGDGYDNVEDR